MTNKKAISIIKDELKHCQIHLRDKNKAPEYYQEMNELCEAYEMAIKALENSSHIIEALEELKDDTLDELVSFGVEKSIDCIKNMRRKQHDKS
jgi:hypothetical protein